MARIPDANLGRDDQPSSPPRARETGPPCSGSSRWRGLLVALTERRRARLDEVAAAHLEGERELLAVLSPEEQVTLAALLRKLLVAFERERPTPPPSRGQRVGRPSRSEACGA